MFDLYNNKVMSYQIIDNTKTYNVSLNLEDGEGEIVYYFNKLIINSITSNWSNYGLIRNRDYSIYKYKITSSELLEPNMEYIYRVDLYLELLKNNEVIDISSPNYFLKKIIEINSEKLKNFPEKITIAGEEFVYQEFEIMGSKIYGYLNEKEDGYLNQKEEDKMIIFIPTILGGSFQKNHLFLCHKFTHEYGKKCY